MSPEPSAFLANISGQATTVAHRIIYDSDDGILYFDIDETGALGRVRFASIEVGLALLAGEFSVV